MNEKQLFKSTWLKWGVILGVASFIFSVALSFLGLFGNQKVGWLGFVISIAVIILAYKSYKEENRGYMKFGRGVGMAAMIGLIGGVISTALLLGYMVLDDSMMDQMIDNQVKAVVKQAESQGGEASEEDIRAYMDTSTMRTVTIASIAVVGPIGSVIICVLIGLIASAVMKNPPPEGYVESDELIDQIGDDDRN
jgi:hypothetical protein